MNKAIDTPTRQVKFSIFVRCAVIIASAATIVATTVTLSSFDRTRQIAFEGLLAKAEAITRSIAAPAGGAIRFSRTESVAQELDLLYTANGGHAVAAVVTDAAGSRVIADGPGLAGLADDLAALAAEAVATGRDVTDAARFLVAEPVRFGPEGEVVGAVAIAWSTDATMNTLARAKIEVLALAALALGAALAGAILYLRRTVTRPLREIGHAMKTVVSGAYDIAIPQTGRRDEIGLMARDVDFFRGMMSDASGATRSAMFQSAAFRCSSAAMVLADRDFNITMTNAAFDTLCGNNEADFKSTFQGFELATLVGRNIDVFHGNPTRNRKMVLEPGALPMKTDIRIASRVMQLSIDGIADEKGEIVGYVVEWNDVTDIRRDAAVLRGLEMRQVGMRFTPEWIFESGSGQFDALAGSNAVHLKGRKAQDLVKAEGMDFEAVKSRLAKGETVNGRFHLTLDAGAARILDGSFLPIRDAKGRVLGNYLLGMDITEQSRALAAAETASREMQAAQMRAIDILRTGLSRLRDGDLTFTITQPLGEEYETLRADFNGACSGLKSTILGVGEMVETVQSDVREIASASDNLSRRTEHQAATLEETAAALAQITAAVNSASEAARNALAVVTEARGNAESSGRVVEEAVSAMGEISQSSRQISRIVSVIDDIAFQTNLLALNAGVEAARAGDAGRGFAVVASEVRALAQRSSDAAREIGGLISASGRHVDKGVDLVGEAGEALRRIAASVNGISDHVANIAHSAQEQSSSLNEVNTSMIQLDQVTQQNAAMFEETTAASQSLMSQAEALAAQMARFHVGDKAPTTRRPEAQAAPAAAPRAPAASLRVPEVAPARGSAAGAKARKATDGALALRVTEDNWEDF